ncbi:MAG: multidrug transporter [Oribacterium sp.]|nr:multidrug transporter [Oribacterium sp.]
MNQFGYPESDWKLYKSKIADWQEGYMEKLCKEYIALLSSDKLPSDRFWELEKRIREDKRATGVVVTNSRSKMIDNILDLLHEGAITLDDLSDFSEELKEKIKFLCSRGYFRDPDAKISLR